MAASKVAQLTILFITALTFRYSLLRLSIQVKQTLHLRASVSNFRRLGKRLGDLAEEGWAMDIPSVLHDMRNYMDSEEATNPQPQRYSSSQGFLAIVETTDEEDGQESDEE